MYDRTQNAIDQFTRIVGELELETETGFAPLLPSARFDLNVQLVVFGIQHDERYTQIAFAPQDIDLGGPHFVFDIIRILLDKLAEPDETFYTKELNIQ